MAHHANVDLAAPFFIAAAMASTSAIVGLLVIARMRTEYEKILSERNITEAQRGISLQPRNLADMCNWIVDAGSILTSISAPVIGWLLLNENRLQASVFDVVYASVLLLTFSGLILFVFKVTPQGYANRPLGLPVHGRHRGVRSIGPFTPVTMLIIMLNAAAGLVLWASG